jgi:TolB-like protein/Tfp pilus assembly protein PilF
MITRATIRCNLLLSAALLLIACGKHAYKNGEAQLQTSDYNATILRLKTAESKNPSDWKVKRDLGIAFYKNQQITAAIAKLSQALRLQPKDRTCLLYLGLSFETEQNFGKARAVYHALSSLDVNEALKKELRARIRDIHLKQLQQEIKQNAADLKAGRLEPAASNTVAVLYFRNLSQWDELDPVLKGLAEIMAHDLSKIKNLQVIERLKVQVLMEELRLSSADFFDQIRAPDAGRLLNAHQMISGSVERLDDIKIRLNGGVVETETGRLRGEGVRLSGNISDILGLEKRAMLDFIEDLGLRPTLEEEAAIQPPATNNNLAFIAFCKGLDYEDQQQFGPAQAQYEQALKLDPDFNLAQQKLSQLPGNRLSTTEMEKLTAGYKQPPGRESHSIRNSICEFWRKGGFTRKPRRPSAAPRCWAAASPPSSSPPRGFHFLSSLNF